MRSTLLIILSLLTCTVVQAQKPIVLSDTVDRYEVRDVAKVMYDEKGTVNPEDLFKGKHDKKFVDYKKLHGNGNDKEGTYWIKFSAKNNSVNADKFLLEAFDPKIGYIDFFYMNDQGQLDSVQGGNAKSFEDRVIQHKNNLFFLPVNPGDSKDFYVRMKSERVVAFRMVIRRNYTFINYALKEYTFIGVFIGLVLMIIIFNVSLYFNTRSKTFLYYVLFVIGNLLFALSINGIGFEYFWPNTPGFNGYGSPIGMLMLSVFLLLYLRSFLKLKDNDPLFYKLVSATVIARLFIFLLAVTFFDELLYDTRIDILPFAIGFIVGVRNYKRERSAFKFLLLGFFCLFIGFFFYVLWFNGYLKSAQRSNYQLLYVYSLDIATILEMIFFSLAISKRLQNLFEQKEKADKVIIEQLQEKEELTQKVNRELESKVQERTTELYAMNKDLEDANTRLKELTEEVNQLNLKLDMENRSLAKDIKQVNKSRIMMKEASEQEFQNIFPDDLSCYRLLEQLKWGDEFSCKRCSNNKYNKGNTKFSRRCTKCNYEESATVNTLLHRTRFPMTQAFYMIYLITNREGKITVDELQDITGLRRATVWGFRKKVLSAMEGVQSSKKGKPEWEELLMYKE